MNLKNNQITMRELLANPKARALLRREFPDVMNSPLLSFAENMTLQNVLEFARSYVPQHKVRSVMAQLKEL